MAGRDICVHVVDSFEGVPDDRTQSEPERSGRSVQEEFLSNLRATCIEDIVSIHAVQSDEAVALFEDHSLDLVFIDGDHRYEAVRADIHHYLPNIKPGGILAGRDYAHSAECSQGSRRGLWALSRFIVELGCYRPFLGEPVGQLCGHHSLVREEINFDSLAGPPLIRENCSW
ncbi:MAG: hypothetical protein HONBIEJF_02541 [Fimbriimonadaceae bacterium]|nr:hypothetical protein [Fimbriimonadaceae bacterium]